jgi:peptide/nickel transport system ATP-binding protein
MNQLASHPLLEVKALSVDIATRGGTVAAVRDVSIAVAPGEIVGIVGESGSGKSVTALAIMGVLPAGARVNHGCIRFAGNELDIGGGKGGPDRRGLAIIFQNPRAALNPIRPVGRQIADALRVRFPLSAQSASARAVELLDHVRIHNPKQRFWSYPFELSGGMCQRVMIAIALACEPRLLIADEPTTGLDVTTQKSILDLIDALATERRMATLLITHDLALAGERCSRLAVMRRGRVVEVGLVANVLRKPRDPYTRALAAAMPQAACAPDSTIPDRLAPAPLYPLLAVEALRREFRVRGARPSLWARLSRSNVDRESASLYAVDDVAFRLTAGDSVGIVGESGSGKSTLAGLVVRLIDPTAGRIFYCGADIGSVAARSSARAPFRPEIQMVFQDPSASLNPRSRAFDAVAEPIRRFGNPGDSLAVRVHELAEMVGLAPALLSRLPHQLSGGEKARVEIARAIALRPRILVLDEPTASLDVRVQAIILDLLKTLRSERQMTYLFISHDLAVVRKLCNRLLVMRAGRIVESGPTEQILTAPSHPYTRALVAAIPVWASAEPE